MENGTVFGFLSSLLVHQKFKLWSKKIDNNIKDLKQKLDTIQQDLDRLNQIGIALSSEKNLEKLLEMIVTEVRGFTLFYIYRDFCGKYVCGRSAQ